MHARENLERRSHKFSNFLFFLRYVTILIKNFSSVHVSSSRRDDNRNLARSRTDQASSHNRISDHPVSLLLSHQTTEYFYKPAHANISKCQSTILTPLKDNRSAHNVRDNILRSTPSYESRARARAHFRARISATVPQTKLNTELYRLRKPTAIALAVYRRIVERLFFPPLFPFSFPSFFFFFFFFSPFPFATERTTRKLEA